MHVHGQTYTQPPHKVIYTSGIQPGVREDILGGT